MNVARRNASVDVPTRRAPRPAMLRPASVLLLSLSAAWANADDCDPVFDNVVWESTGCESPRSYLDICPFGQHARKARECIEWDEVKECEDIEKVLDFRKRFEGGQFESEADACIIAKRLQACSLVHDTRAKFDCLQEAQKGYKYNMDVLAAINELRNGILASAEEAISDEDVPAAESAIEDMETLFPRDQALRDLLRDLRNRLEGLKEHLRSKQLQRELEDQVRELIAERKFGEALEELKRADESGMTGKTLDSLKREATEGLAALNSIRQKRRKALAEARRLREAEDFGGARNKLEEARRFELTGKTYDAELEAIAAAEDRKRKRKQKQEALAEARRLREAEDFGGARNKLEEARELGLGENEYRAELEAIEKAKAGSRKLAERLRECKAQLDGSKLDEALACYQEVLEWDKGHSEAKKQVPRLEMLVEWRATDRANDIGRYHAFEQKYKERRDLGRFATSLSRLAREKLNSKQDEFWKSVEASGSRDMYERYVTIYPEGRYVGEAREWLENEG